MSTVTRRFEARATFVGFVTRKIWRYDNQLRFRLAVPDRPSEALGTNARLNFYTIVVPRDLSRTMRIEPGALVSVVAKPISREYQESLARFLKFANGQAPQIDAADSILVTRIRTEFIAEVLTFEPKSLVEQSTTEQMIERAAVDDTGANALE